MNQNINRVKEAAGPEARVSVNRNENGDTKIYIVYKPPVVQRSNSMTEKIANVSKAAGDSANGRHGPPGQRHADFCNL
jgi:hypothetical protein